MATSKKFSELPVASSMNNGDLFAVAQEDAQAETGYTSKSATALVVGKKLNGEIEYATDLPSFPPGDQNPLDALEYLNSKINDLYPVDSASGSIANFTTSLALPLVALKAYIQAQGGGGTPSEPVEIVGWDNVKIYQRGVNLWDEETETGSIDNTTGQNTINANTFRTVGYIRVFPQMKVYVVKPDGQTLGFRYYDINKNFVSTFALVNSGVVTIPNNVYYLRFVNVSTNTYGNNIAILYPSSVTDYEAYNGTEYIINLGQTCYGGYIDKNTGKLIIDSAYKSFDGTETFTSSTNNRFFYTVDDVIQPTVSTSDLVLSSHFVSRTQSQQDDQAVWKTTGNKIIVFRDTSIADLTAWTNFLTTQYNNGTPVQLVYKLAVPIETDITIPDITVLVGENNIWADTGNIEVSYKMGVQEYIDKKIAEVQALVL